MLTDLTVEIVTGPRNIGNDCTCMLCQNDGPTKRYLLPLSVCC